MSIDATSRLIVTTGTLAPFTSGQLATLNNAGLIDMSTDSSSTTDSLTVNGNYIGTGGRLALQTMLGADNSPSDKLVVSQGT
ncbi:autotransporter outer membrane beta-barrel domain-containing protein, partial [Acinetobacter baumannii]|nr:autotransporter outer membrane beta-barrel domain-containing protein [Acinetobacter baumannii]